MTIHYKRVKNIVLIVTVSSLMIAILVFLSGGFTTSTNGFKRRIEMKLSPIMNTMKKPPDVREIAAITNDQIYFQTTIPGKLLATDHYLNKRKYLLIRYSSDEKIASMFYTVIDSPSVYLLAGNNGTIARANLTDKNFRDYPFKLQSFTRAVLIGPSTFVIRGTDTSSTNPDQAFFKIHTATTVLETEKGISEKKGDAGIATDGLLHYDSLTRLITYTFFYNNGFICFDTALALVYKGRTIDTTNTYQIRTGSFGTATQKIYTNSGPSRIVNWQSDVDSGKLYINSWIKADNESVHTFNNNSVIDAYDIKSGTYQKSFYIPFYKGEKMESFRVYKNRIIVLYKSNIVLYEYKDTSIPSKNDHEHYASIFSDGR